MLKFSELIAPCSVDDFVSSYQGRQALHLKNEASKHKDLFGWDSINDILNNSNGIHSSSKVYRDGRPVSVKSRLDILEAVRNGGSLIIEEIDRFDAKLGNFLDELSDELCIGTRFNMYMSYPKVPAYNLHYDTHDFLILQIEGNKEWHIYPKTLESPLFFQKEHDVAAPKPDELVQKCLLTKGDVLYVPRGMWHDAVAAGEPSVHLTLAMFRKTGIDFFGWLVDELRDLEDFRRDFPLPIGPHSSAPEIYQAEAARLFEKFQSFVSNKRLGYRYHQFSTARQRSRRTFQFPQHFGFEFAANNLPAIKRNPMPTTVEVDEDAGYLHLVADGRVFQFPDITAELLGHLLSNDVIAPADLDEFLEELGSDTVCTVLQTLIAEGLLLVDKTTK